MSISKRVLVLACAVALAVPVAWAAKPGSLNFVNGPVKAQLGDVAQVEVPSGYRFLDGKGTRALMKAEGEPTSGNELGMLTPTNKDWAMFFQFAAEGYVKDDDKDKLDPDKLLASYKRGTAQQNKERESAGAPPIEIIGWEVPPKYDEASHNLEWAIRATCGGEPLLNYNTRLLGRKGYMEVILVIDPDKLPATLPAFRNILAGYSFQTGQTYAEYRAGDKVAKYGLAALVLGGAAVGAAKLGLLTGLLVFLKKGWKLVVVAFAAVAAAIKKFLARVFGGRRETELS